MTSEKQHVPRQNPKSIPPKIDTPLALLSILSKYVPRAYIGGGGGIRKALVMDYLEHPGSACSTDEMFELFVRFGRCVYCLLPLFVNR